MPAIKPPICANHATPPVVLKPKLPRPFVSWLKNQNPNTINAGILKVVKKIIIKAKTCTLAFGNRIIYIPKTPAIAPEAPTIGMVEPGLINSCDIVAATPHRI